MQNSLASILKNWLTQYVAFHRAKVDQTENEIQNQKKQIFAANQFWFPILFPPRQEGSSTGEKKYFAVCIQGMLLVEYILRSIQFPDHLKTLTSGQFKLRYWVQMNG